jgi:hypothetical protein
VRPLVLSMVSVRHLHVRCETGATIGILVLGVASALIVLVTFTVTTLVRDLPSLFTLSASSFSALHLNSGGSARAPR